MARVNGFTAEQVIKALQEGHTPLGAATLLGCARITIMRYVERFPTVREALYQERMKLKDIAYLGLHNALLNQQPWAIAMTLKALAKDEGFTNREEAIIKNLNLADLTDHQLERLANGDDLYTVLADKGASGPGTAEAAETGAEQA